MQMLGLISLQSIAYFLKLMCVDYPFYLRVSLKPETDGKEKNRRLGMYTPQLYLDDPAFNGELHQINGGFKSEFLHDVVFVRFNGPDADKEFFGDFRIAPAFGKQTEDFGFAACEGAFGFLPVVFGLADKTFKDHVGYRTAEILPAIVYGIYCIFQLGMCGGFRQVTTGAGTNGIKNVIF